MDAKHIWTLIHNVAQAAKKVSVERVLNLQLGLREKIEKCIASIPEKIHAEFISYKSLTTYVGQFVPSSSFEFPCASSFISGECICMNVFDEFRPRGFIIERVTTTTDTGRLLLNTIRITLAEEKLEEDDTTEEESEDDDDDDKEDPAYGW